jgi:protein-S-isoprenylcysteine O-methyltransferase Ste14
LVFLSQASSVLHAYTVHPQCEATKVTREKLHDLAMASPIILWFAVGAVGSSLRALELFGAKAGTAQISLQIATVVFLMVAIALFIIRKPPIKKAKGAGPVLAGVIGCLTPFLVLVLPRATLSQSALAVLSALGLLGTAASIYVLFWLGRSFSILPQARGLVTNGPYRSIRHPLYLAEFVIIASKAFELAPPWAVVALMVAIGSQIARIHYEEEVLSEAFPDYKAYARRTARLIPGVY